MKRNSLLVGIWILSCQSPTDAQEQLAQEPIVSEQAMIDDLKKSQIALERVTTIINALTLLLKEENNIPLLAEHLTELVATMLPATDNLITADCALCKQEEIVTTRTHHEASDNNAAQDQSVAEEKQQRTQLVLTNVALIATHVAQVIAAPKNPRVVGQSIANMLANILNIVTIATNKRK